MATVTKNFRIKSGLIVEGTSGTINGHNILTESTSGDQYILNLVGGATLVKSVDSMLTVDGSGKLTINANTYDAYGSASAAQSAAESFATTAANNAQSAAEATAASDATTKANTAKSEAISAAATDATTKANAAQAAAESTAALDATSKANAAQAAAEATASADATSKANAAQSNAEDYADAKISDANGTATDKAWSAYKTSTEIGLAQAAAEQHADEAVAALVGLAPSTLDTIEELATALENNPDIIANLESVAAGKQDALTAGSNIDITGSTISVTGLDSQDISDFNSAALSATAAAYDAAGAASAAQTAAQTFATNAANAADTSARGYADGLASNYDAAGSALAAQTAAEATAQEALDDVLDATTPFTEINVNDQAKQIAATASINTGSASTVYQWAKADYRSAKLLVKIDNGTHNEVSEILVTLDSSDNVAITEYAIVGTNGSRGTVSASVSGSNVIVTVNPTDNSTVKVTGTLLK